MIALCLAQELVDYKLLSDNFKLRNFRLNTHKAKLAISNSVVGEMHFALKECLSYSSAG